MRRTIAILTAAILLTPMAASCRAKPLVQTAAVIQTGNVLSYERHREITTKGYSCRFHLAPAKQYGQAPAWTKWYDWKAGEPCVDAVGDATGYQKFADGKLRVTFHASLKVKSSSGTPKATECVIGYTVLNGNGGYYPHREAKAVCEDNKVQPGDQTEKDLSAIFG